MEPMKRRLSRTSIRTTRYPVEENERNNQMSFSTKFMIFLAILGGVVIVVALYASTNTNPDNPVLSEIFVAMAAFGVGCASLWFL